MIGGALDRFDTGSIIFIEVSNNCIKVIDCVLFKGGNSLMSVQDAAFASQRTSTRTRNFKRPNSLKIVRNDEVLLP